MTVPEGAAGSRRERNSDVEVPHCRSIEMLGGTSSTVRLPTFTKHTKHSRAATCTGDYGTKVAAHAPEDRLKSESLDFRRKARVSWRAGVIYSCLLTFGKMANTFKIRN